MHTTRSAIGLTAWMILSLHLICTAGATAADDSATLYSSRPGTVSTLTGTGWYDIPGMTLDVEGNNFTVNYATGWVDPAINANRTKVRLLVDGQQYGEMPMIRGEGILDLSHNIALATGGLHQIQIQAKQSDDVSTVLASNSLEVVSYNEIAATLYSSRPGTVGTLTGTGWCDVPGMTLDVEGKNFSVDFATGWVDPAMDTNRTKARLLVDGQQFGEVPMIRGEGILDLSHNIALATDGLHQIQIQVKQSDDVSTVLASNSLEVVSYNEIGGVPAATLYSSRPGTVGTLTGTGWYDVPGMTLDVVGQHFSVDYATGWVDPADNTNRTKVQLLVDGQQYGEMPMIRGEGILDLSYNIALATGGLHQIQIQAKQSDNISTLLTANSLEVTAYHAVVPEPSSLVSIVGLILIGLLAYARRRRTV